MSGYTIGVDIGGTKTLLVVLDANKKKIYEKKTKSSSDWKYLLDLVKGALSELKIFNNQINSMGIGVAGAVELNTDKIIDAPALKWKQFDLVSILKPHFPFKIFIDNDVNCALVAERSIGALKGCDSAFFISIGTGLGSALMVDRKIVYGANNMAGEIGYQLDKNDYMRGELNVLGEFGIAENKVSGTAFKKWFLSSENFFENLKDGDPSALKVFDEFLIDLSILISNAVCLLNPEKVIIGGGLSIPLKPHIDEIKEKVLSMVPIPAQIELSQLGESVVALGAAINSMDY